MGDLLSPQSPLGRVDGQEAKLGDGVFLLFDAVLQLLQGEVIDHRHEGRILQKGVSEIFLVAAGLSLLALLVVVQLPQLELRGSRPAPAAHPASSAADD
ncbi:hypothetical protein [Allomeiothermus silvanus]|uniref:hypothetical protein n=1 Tax=Allomeiothermus silvanus TaxID=52022 RepID=UPI00019E9E31|nr:hypothetical protein [Allomeiothermus silvanus]